MSTNAPDPNAAPPAPEAADSTASTAPATSPPNPAAPAAAAASASMAASAASPVGKLYAGPGCSGVFLVEDIERCQADVRDFLLTESDLVTHSGVLSRYIRCRSLSCRGCAARQRQRQPSGPQQRYSARTTVSVRSWLRARHGRVLPHLRGNVRPIGRYE
jgi:hypothetical protein